MQLPHAHQSRRYVQHAVNLRQLYVSAGIPLAAGAGGVKKIEAVNRLKAQTLYETIDGSGRFYINRIRPNARSKMDVVLQTRAEELDRRFLLDAELQDL